MKTSTRLAAIFVAALATGANAQVLLPFSRQTSPQHGSAPQQRRSGSEDTKATDVKFYPANATYMVNVVVGTPAQNLSLGLTLSDYTSWVPDADRCDRYYSYYSPYHEVTRDDCLRDGFKANESSTLVYEVDERSKSYGNDDDDYYGPDNNKTFSAYYQDGTSAYGKSVRDVMGLPGGARVSNLTFGLASSSDTATGVLALGFNNSNSYSAVDDPSFLDSLLAGGQVNSLAFSMWLDSEDASSGNLLLGAVDRSAFEAPLVRFDIEQSRKDADGYTYKTGTFNAWVTAFNTSTANEGGALTPVQNKTELPFVTIDPSYTISELPQDLAEHLWSMAGATWDPYYDMATINCSQRDNVTGRVAIQFASSEYGPNLTVPLSDLVLPKDAWNAQTWYSDREVEVPVSICAFGVQNATIRSRQKPSLSYSGEREYTIGAPLLKRSYLVFDLASKEMAMAPVKYGASRTEGDILAFPTYGANIPESTHVVCLESPGGYHKLGYNCSSLGGTHRGSGSGGSAEDGGLSRGGLIGLIVGLSIFGLIMLVVAIWGIVKCCRDNKRLQAENGMGGSMVGGGGEGAYGPLTALAPVYLPFGAGGSAIPGSAPKLPSIPEVSQIDLHRFTHAHHRSSAS
ncbi:hypothetical protein PG996_014344 [Apiospora saccharicola]|uniref:Peptidase A1 domain-containing protein n=1 Tax=Apiospora saccharicola TaxID=335842 RepID=A0ABR1TK28_9PEZI